MCLAIPGKIESIAPTTDPLFRQGIVSFDGIRKEVNLSMVPEAKEGHYVLVHVGVAINIMDEEEAMEILELFNRDEIREELDESGEGETVENE